MILDPETSNPTVLCPDCGMAVRLYYLADHNARTGCGPKSTGDWKEDLRIRLRQGSLDGSMIPMTEEKIEDFVRAAEEDAARTPEERARRIADFEGSWAYDEFHDGGEMPPELLKYYQGGHQ